MERTGKVEQQPESMNHAPGKPERKAKGLDFADFYCDHHALLNHAEMLQCANILVRQK